MQLHEIIRLRDDNNNDSGDPEPREVDLTDGCAVISRDGQSANWRGQDGSSYPTPASEPDGDPDDGLTVEPTKSVDSPNSDGMP